MDDQILLTKIIKHNDKEAFEELYNLYGDYALRVATAVTGDSSKASDAVQETFIRIYFNIKNFKLDKPFKPWLYKILINECNRILRKGGKITYISDYIENNVELSEEDKHNFEEYEDLYVAIKNLDSINKTPIVLKYLGGFKEKEISQILNININTLKSRLLKGRQKLKKVLEKNDERRNTNERR
ncbi:sigma-70 family RNA polymerase sigma factor [Alkalibaculum sp. M08DMB]|uniref:Sigma-70 family RNA polymerase sigma factor n=1 Tax=Alkalibaculum sporogenes TaxID=2655001 RepID=A0A6A7K6W5_9FIRM|nr:RNA polymerase sigma factor [Alkalibaculum sporogenes]MPW25154.1 sigma-70 family RNA polymerase sigma factor [Alkalibaculum sporogenes]